MIANTILDRFADAERETTPSPAEMLAAARMKFATGGPVESWRTKHLPGYASGGTVKQLSADTLASSTAPQWGATPASFVGTDHGRTGNEESGFEDNGTGNLLFENNPGFYDWYDQNDGKYQRTTQKLPDASTSDFITALSAALSLGTAGAAFGAAQAGGIGAGAANAVPSVFNAAVDSQAANAALGTGSMFSNISPLTAAKAGLTGLSLLAKTAGPTQQPMQNPAQAASVSRSPLSIAPLTLK